MKITFLLVIICYFQFQDICMLADETFCNHYNRDITCENDIATINCKQNRIYIIDGFYGRKDQETCGGPIKESNCVDENDKNIMNKKCHCKKRCSIDANNEVFGDPCVETRKYLNITYLCIRLSKKNCNDHQPSANVPCSSRTTPEVTTTSSTTATTTPTTTTIATTIKTTSTMMNPTANSSEATTTSSLTSTTHDVPTEEHHITFLTSESTGTPSNTLPQNEIPKDAAHAFPTAAWIGVAIASLILIAVFVTLFFKRQQVFKNFAEHNHNDHHSNQDNSVSKNHIYANEFSSKNTNDNATAYENFEFGSEYQEVGKGPSPNSQMTSNIIYNAFEPNKTAINAQNLVNGNVTVHKNSFKMTLDVVYDHGHHSERHANGSHATAQNNIHPDAEAEKTSPVVADNDQPENVYNFAENVSAEPSTTVEMVYNDLYQSYTG